MEKRIIITIFACVLAVMTGMAASVDATPTDTAGRAVNLGEVSVKGKSVKQQAAVSALSIGAVDVRKALNSSATLRDLVDRSSGVRVRREGGVGSDFDLSINGLSGNSIRFFIDGVPLDTKGSEVNLGNLPLNTVSRVEIYKGVVPASLGGDALGGAVNIITNSRRSNYLDFSYGIGSFYTHNVDLTGLCNLGKTHLWIRPTFSMAYSKNDYMMKNVEVWSEEEDKYVEANRRRFHDDYRSLLGQIELGVSDVNWADRLMVTATYSDVRKDIQTGATQARVFGEAERKAHAWSIGANYAKRWGAVNTRFNLSHTWDHSATIDTAFRKYNWNGTWLPSSGNEITGRDRSWRVYKRPLTVVGAGIDWDINSHHNVALNYMLNRRGNDRYDKRDENFEPSNDVVLKHIVAATYSARFFDDRLRTTAFGKSYINSLEIEQTDMTSISGADKINPHATKTYWGGGAGARYTICEPLQLKASYEHSVRLPNSRELLGNGTTIYPNLALSPETSNNWNAGLFGTWMPASDHMLSYEAGGFLRHVQNYIRAQVSERDGMMQYFNEPAVEIKGVELDMTYTWRSALQLSVNATYSDARDLRKYKTDGNPSATYKNKVPNRPWLFANAELSYTWRNVIPHADDRLRLTYAWQWVHWYYLNWEAYGAKESKAVIPTQNVSDIAVNYSFAGERYNVSVECSNLFDCIVYDNYMLQKPGRAFYAKFRLYLH